MTPRTAPRIAWLGAAAILVVAALVALGAILRGDFSETDGRILGTLAAVLYTGGALFAGLSVVERGHRIVGWPLAAAAPVCFLLILPAVWSVFDESGDDNVWRRAPPAAQARLTSIYARSMPREAELVPASHLDDEELAALFSASYEGYLVPFAVDAAAMRFLTEAYDLDRDASLIAVRDGERVGLANLGLRGADAWVGGVGVVPEERRRGTGRKLMEGLHDEARSRGVERVWLEVIVENTGAIALYEQLGYGHVRDLEVWSLPGAAGEASEGGRSMPPRLMRGSASIASSGSPGSATTCRSRRSPSPAGFSSRAPRGSYGWSAAAFRSSSSPVTRKPCTHCSRALARSATPSAC